MNKKNKKAFFFTIDALLAASVLLGGLVILSSYYINTQPTSHLNYYSQDIINSLDELKIYELNNTYLNTLIADGNITNTNNSVLQQAGEFWASERPDVAYAFMGNITDDMIPSRYGFGLWIGEDMIYQRDSPPPASRSSAKKMISGVEKKKPIKGYISKARASNFIKTGTEIISFSPEGSGWYGTTSAPGEGIVDKYFALPSNMNITNSTFYVSLHIDATGPDWKVIDVNGKNGTCSIMRNELNMTEDGVFAKINIAGCINNGTNQVKLRLRNTGYNGHLHPGMLIKVDYSLSESPSFFNSTISKRYYFDNIVSNGSRSGYSGAWASLPFFIPEEAVNISVSMKISGKNVRDYTGNNYFSSWSGSKRERDYDYIIFLNNATPFDSKANPQSNPTYDYTPSNLSNKIIKGTNVVSVYFNNYGDDSWGGSNSPQIYSNPLNDTFNSSYVEVNYTLPLQSIPYGSVKITKLKEFGGNPSYSKETSFNFPSQAISMGDIFTHIVQQYSYIVDIWADTYTPPSHLVFSAPSSRAVPTTVYMPESRFSLTSTVNNYVRVRDRNNNEILPETAVEYSFYLPSFVGYNGVFATQAEAEANAMTRLNQTLGSFISAQDIVIESSAMTDVPSMWGPAVMDVRVWH